MFLRSRALVVSSDGLEEFDGRLAGETTESVTDEFLALSRRWARTLGVPVWIREDDGEPRPL